MVQMTDAWRQSYVDKFASMVIKPAVMPMALAVATRIQTNKIRYDPAAQATGVPWWFIGCLHAREASLNFTCYLGDGEPLDHVSHNVPKGRGPFKDFTAGAIDALVHEGFQHITDWSIGSALFHAEAYNGEGYHLHGLPSPYVWAGSNQYSHGKYDGDGHYSPSLIDTQLGVAVILGALLHLNILSFNPKTGELSMVTPAPVPVPAAPATVPASIPTAGVNVSAVSQMTGIAGIGFGSIIATAAPILAVVAPQFIHPIVAGATGIAGLGVLFASILGMFHLNSAASNNTMAVIGNLTNMAQQAAVAFQSVSQPNAGIAQNPQAAAA